MNLHVSHRHPAGKTHQWQVNRSSCGLTVELCRLLQVNSRVSEKDCSAPGGGLEEEPFKQLKAASRLTFVILS